MLTKKYYIMIAEVLKGYYWGFKENEKNENELRLLDLMINSFCIKFELDNPRFDKKRFEDYINGKKDTSKKIKKEYLCKQCMSNNTMYEPLTCTLLCLDCDYEEEIDK